MALGQRGALKYLFNLLHSLTYYVGTFPPGGLEEGEPTYIIAVVTFEPYCYYLHRPASQPAIMMRYGLILL